ncbi:MAG: hypothetical protein IJ760_06005 [Bacteroidales bacterium]|nr:hypothetical protein [Bacteroidales bacterium]
MFFDLASENNRRTIGHQSENRRPGGGPARAGGGLTRGKKLPARGAQEWLAAGGGSLCQVVGVVPCVLIFMGLCADDVLKMLNRAMFFATKGKNGVFLQTDCNTKY